MNAKIISLTIAILVIFSLNSSAQTRLNIEGTWRLVSQKIINSEGGVTTSDSAALNQIKVYTPTMFVNVGERRIPQLDNQKMVVSCAGGHYSLNGDVYEEFTEFASYKDYKDLKVKFKLTMENGKMHTVGTLSGADGIITTYDEWYSKVEVPTQSKELTGTWRVISQRVNNPDGSVFTADSTSASMRKVFTPGMVVVIREQAIPKADNQKLVVSCAGGLYTLKNGVYEEFISFASYKDFKSMKAKFDLKFENGKLHTSGILTDGNGQEAAYDEWFVRAD
ncbi:hypothetical protein HQN86_05370 [Pedobacter panaciterrae]|jgi:hypothetical protein|uniref:hypothetical protein n=1 Tax=Pedobacter panaciterrae TaxID=363849 RepID=UPI00155D8B29|nr:hypothetical protein [Pedobacter panaciterrae]NQX53036.1 hypothetical protein [Pedobacter panaciterrae]